MWKKYESETLTEVMTARMTIVDVHAALETTLDTQRKEDNFPVS